MKEGENTQCMTWNVCVCVWLPLLNGGTGCWRRVKIAMLIKGSWVLLRLHWLPHPSHTPPPSKPPTTPALLSPFLFQWIYCPPPLSTGLLNGPQLLNFMPRVNLVSLMVSAELQWRGCALLISLWTCRKKSQKWIWSSVAVASHEAEIQIGSTCTLKRAAATGSGLWTEKLYWKTGRGCKATAQELYHLCGILMQVHAELSLGRMHGHTLKMKIKENNWLFAKTHTWCC